MKKRLTLVVSTEPRHSWDGSSLLVCDSLPRMRQSVVTNDVERVILDRCASADEFLHLLAALPGEVLGDVLSVREDGGAFLSATGRGGDRVLYALSPADVGFYLEANGLSATPKLARSA